MPPAHRQGDYRVRFDWGPAGAAALVRDCDVAVVVDVLSFTTTLTVALDAGTAVYPYRWDPSSAAGYAAERDAVVAVGRSRAAAGEISLSPASVRATPAPARLVLPSPNGSALCFGLAESGVEVVGASLRNASAVATWVRESGADRVAVIAAGERWPDGTLRPAVEDLWGAGAVLSALGVAQDRCAPESRSAAEVFVASSGDLTARLRDCASGRELIEKGFAQDVEIAAEFDASAVVPVLRGEAFVDAAVTA
ncbi:2-phosphosulfolactate phosphatase [Rhodococcus spelaei]|uniref:Probable 2-phosphosulfolactate phosphatase n=1 Tax=Rhodococcus spelaei TaxID=2546320 RepID=A0A541B9A7_9NOCA|nr:2-phosphosulfolactate phosphatase [Rhodococcus spelaei]TQF68883.1 2-phosphosulfolactate phosphatase [Rhodococcus spelaei]